MKVSAQATRAWRATPSYDSWFAPPPRPTCSEDSRDLARPAWRSPARRLCAPDPAAPKRLQSSSGRPAHERRRELPERAHAALLHRRLQLGAQELEHALDAGLAEGAQAPEVRPADAHRARAEREALDDVGAAPEPAVDQHRDAAAHGFDDLGQGVDGGAAAVLAARAVVGDDQAVEAVFHAQRRVLVRQDALDEDLHARDVAHPLEEIPGHVRRFHAGHAREVDAVVVGPAPRPRHDSGLVAVLAIPGVLAAQPE